MSERFRYGVVEAALASMFFIDAENMGAFRGRITNLRRFGITPNAPKKGAPVEYAFSDVSILAYCLSLFEFGLDPVSVQVFFHITGDKALHYLLKDESEDAIFCFYANVMSREFVENNGKKAIVVAHVLPASKATYEEVTRIFRPVRPEMAYPHARFLGTRLCMMNLSHIRRTLLAALSPKDSSSDDSQNIRLQVWRAIDLARTNKLETNR